jgi:sugar phosphate isomerase/epimerase
MNDIRISFSMHPRWVGKEGLESFLAPLMKEGLSALEFELDSHLEGWNDMIQLIERSSSLGMELCFHAPYRNPYYVDGFATDQREAIIRDYRPMLAIAQGWAEHTREKKMVVIHGARAEGGDKRKLTTDTLAFCTWILETFPGVKVALENNLPGDQNMVKAGVSRQDVLRMVKTIHSSNLGICWDMGHDYHSHTEEEPSSEWLKNVVHVHVHDENEHGEDHFPLVFGRVPHKPWLHALVQAGMKGIVTLELKGGNLKNWKPDEITKALVQSIATIKAELA